MSGASAGAGAGPSSPALRLCWEDGRAEWLRFYDLVEAQVEALAADRAHLEATRGEGKEAILPGVTLDKLQEGDLEDVRACRGLLALHNTESKEVQDRLELSENTGDHEHIVKSLRANLGKLKGAFESLLSKKDKDAYSIKVVLLNQLRTMEKDNKLFENKKLEAAQATEEAKKHQQNVQALLVAAQNKDDEIGRLQAEALVAQQKLHEMDSLLKEKDESIEKLRAENIDLLAVKGFLLSQFQIKEQELLDYAMLLKNKEVAAAQATEAAQKLVKENRTMEAEVVDYGNKLLILEDKLKVTHSLVKGKDDEIQKLKNRQPEITSLKRKCASSLSNEPSQKRRRYIVGKHIASIRPCKSGCLCFGCRTNKEVAAAQATEAAQNLVKENRTMEAEVVDYGDKLLILEDKLKEAHSLVKEKDDEIQELENRQLEITSLKRKCASSLPNETSQKRRRDIVGMHIASIQRCKSGRQCFGRRTMQIFVKTTNSRTYTLKVKSSNKIEYVEAKMRDHRLDVQGLIFAGKKLVYCCTLGDYNIKNLSTLQLVLHLRISVKMLTDEIINLVVKSSDTIKHVKAMIQSQKDVPWDKQGLIFAGKRLEDGRTLADYDIETVCTFELVPFLHLHLIVKTLTDKTIDLAVLSSDTIEDVKAMVYDQVGIPSYVQQFFFAGRMLEDDRTLADYDIHKYSTFHLVLSFCWNRNRVIRIKTLTGKTICPAVDIRVTIEDIKAIIHEREGVPPSQQRLFIDGKPLLHNDCTLVSYISGDRKVIVIHLLHRRAPQPRRIVDRARRLRNKQELGHVCL